MAKKKKQEQKAPADRQFRELLIAKDTINVDARTVELAFASETPVERFYGDEILDLSPSSVRLGRLNDGGPLLLNHDTDEQIGVVESVNIGSDRVGRAVVRFGKGECADEIFQDVVDGIRRKVSVGYQIYSMILDSKDGDANTYRVTDWEPLEISIVSVPADNSVGVGRNLPTKKEPIMEKETTEVETRTAQVAAPVQTVDVRAIEADTRKKEMTRIADLNKIGETFAQFGGKELASQCISEGRSVDDLNAMLLQRAGTKPTQTAEIGMTETETRNFSFVRALHALANPTDRRAQENAAFEMEASRAAAEKHGKEARGLIVPFDVLKAESKRALSVGTGTAGGYSVATDLLSGSFIDLLRNKIVVSQLGATTLNGLQGNIAIPRQTGAATAYWVAEASAPTASAQAIDQVIMSPKTVAAYTDFSRKLMIQSSLDVEAMVRNDLARVLALEIDRVAFYGSGSSNQPLGIKGSTGIGTTDFAADTPTFAELVGLETKLGAANADMGSMAYVTNATQRGALKTAPKIGSTYPVFIWEGDQINGYKAVVSNQITTGSSTGIDVFFGNFNDLVLGYWSGLDIMVDPYSNSTTGSLRVTAFQDTDVAVRHGASFARGCNSL